MECTMLVGISRLASERSYLEIPKLLKEDILENVLNMRS